MKNVKWKANPGLPTAGTLTQCILVSSSPSKLALNTVISLYEASVDQGSHIMRGAFNLIYMSRYDPNLHDVYG